jgi:hypothetical protein
MVLVAISVGIYRYPHRSALPAKGRVPLYVAEFTNSTGDAVFDDVLRHIVGNELNRSPAVQVVVLSGQEREAQKTINGLLQAYPGDTFLNELDEPITLAAYQLSVGQVDAALRTLDRVKPFEFGAAAEFLPNYIRALAYLRLRRPEDAAGEFSAVLKHRGVSPLSPILVVVAVGLGPCICTARGGFQKSRCL